MAGQGFASKSKQERGNVASKGGRTAHKRGTAFEWTEEQAKEASEKGVRARKRNAILRAAQTLLKEGFTVEDLNLLKLSPEEYIYFGGKKSNPTRIEELRDKLKVLRDAL